jgi:hypothetical protein
MVVKAFYRQHAGFFLFVFLLFFGIVQPSTQLYFHYALIRGMLEAPALMFAVAVAWLLYGLRVRRFVLGVLEGPDALFLYKVNARPPAGVLREWLRVETVLFAPVLGYAGVVAGVAIAQKAQAQALGVLAYVAGLIGLEALEVCYRLRYPGISAKAGRFRLRYRSVPYWSILLRFLLAENKGVLAAVKLFSCAILYLLLRLQTPGDYDLRMPFLVYSLALFGHGILFYRCRQLETMRLYFYRGLPVPVFRRLAQYALFCLLLLLPETLLLAGLTPHPVRLADALIFGGMGYGLLLLLNSLWVIWPLSAADYLKLCLVLFGILYVFVLKVWG